jgi:DNA-binding transcriptional regulator YiaG
MQQIHSNQLHQTPATKSALHQYIRSAPDWKTTEIRVLREHYNKGGAIACRHQLPKRSIQAIRAKASELGIRAPQVSGEEMRARFSAPKIITPELEEMIREAHRLAIPGWHARLAEKLGKSRPWLSAHVSRLGLASPRTAPMRWTKEEVQILTEHAEKSAETVQKHMKAAGYARTAAAINTQRLRIGVDRHDPDTWNCGELARLIGVSSTTVSKWMDLGHLKFERKSESSSSHRMVTRKQFQKFARVHIHLIDLRKVEQVWFKDVMWGTA